MGRVHFIGAALGLQGPGDMETRIGHYLGSWKYFVRGSSGRGLHKR